MIPQPIGMRRVSRATSAVTAVDDRASNECFRHHGYASASQNESNPASSHAFAIRTVSSVGSMLSCNTPMRNGIAIEAFSLSSSKFSLPGFGVNDPTFQPVPQSCFMPARQWL